MNKCVSCCLGIALAASVSTDAARARFNMASSSFAIRPGLMESMNSGASAVASA